MSDSGFETRKAENQEKTQTTSPLSEYALSTGLPDKKTIAKSDSAEADETKSKGFELPPLTLVESKEPINGKKNESGQTETAETADKSLKQDFKEFWDLRHHWNVKWRKHHNSPTHDYPMDDPESTFHQILENEHTTELYLESYRSGNELSKAYPTSDKPTLESNFRHGMDIAKDNASPPPPADTPEGKALLAGYNEARSGQTKDLPWTTIVTNATAGFHNGLMNK